MRSQLSILLRPFGVLYGAIVQVRNILFDWRIFRIWRSPIPVVAIGNLSAGGTGKTPLVDWVVKYYLSIGCKPAIISRGYRRESKGVKLVSDGHKVLLSSKDAGDETAMLAWNNPDAIVVVAEKRKKAAAFITRHYGQRSPSVLILDDAFQHRQMYRTLNIAIINAAEPFFDARMLPEGRLREPLKNIARADLIVLNKITDKKSAEPIINELEKTGRPIVQARSKIGEMVCFSGECNSSEEALLEQPPMLAFAGIASPESFIESLRSEGINVTAHRFFKDHEPYTAKKLRTIRQEADEKGLSLVTTEKDYFRMLGSPELIRIITARPCYYLRIAPDIIAGEAHLKAMLRDVVGKQAERKRTGSATPSRFSKLP